MIVGQNCQEEANLSEQFVEGISAVDLADYTRYIRRDFNGKWPIPLRVPAWVVFS